MNPSTCRYHYLMEKMRYVFEIFSHCRCASVLGRNQDCVITIACTTYVFKVNFTKVSMEKMYKSTCVVF